MILNRRKTIKNFLIFILFLLLFFTVSPTKIYSYICGPGFYCNPGYADEAVGDGVWRKTSTGRCYEANSSYSYTCSCGTPCDETCNGSVGTFHYDSSCSGDGFSLGCCKVGNSNPPTCVKVCSTPSCDVTDAMCAAANNNNTNYDVYSAKQGAAYCPGNNATCSVASNCPGENCTDTKYCYRAATCKTDCTLTCDTGETETATPTPRPSGCEPRAISCSNTTDCGLNNSCPDSTGTCYPIGACQSCTPTTPSGYHTPVSEETTNESLPECKTTNRCDKKYLCSQGLCGTPTYVENTFYRDERNTTNPASPTNPVLRIDNENFPLSTNSSVITRIKKPLPTSAENTVSFSITGISVDATKAYGPWYDYNVENKGINFVWFDSTPYNCTGSANEDFCFSGETSTSKDFHGTFVGHKTPTQILLEDAQGTVAYRSKTTDRCTSGDRYSDWTYPSYKVNNLPVVTDISISGRATTSKGCTASTSFTGQEANNPLTITVRGTDVDDPTNLNNEINGLMLWLVKDDPTNINLFNTNLEKKYWVGPGPTQTDPNMIGVFIAGSSPSASVYKSNNPNGTLTGWGRDTHDGTITGIPSLEVQDASDNILISEVFVESVSGSALTSYKEYKIRLTFPTTSPLTNIVGNYKVYAGFTDIYSYRSISDVGTYMETWNTVNYGNKSWNFDFINPTISGLSSTFNDQQLVTTIFNSNDIGSDIKDTALNIYISVNPREIQPLEPTGLSNITPHTAQSIQTGKINPIFSGWHVNYKINQFKFNILENASGEISIYPTVYDKACNYVTAATPSSLDLNRWIATKGGIFFSEGVVNYVPKSQVPNINFWNLGSELISLKSNDPTVLNWTPDTFKNPTKVLNVDDSNYTQKAELFAVLKERIEVNKNKNSNIHSKSTVSSPAPINLNTCLTNEVCIFQGAPNSDLVIGVDQNPTTDTFYKGKILVFSDRNITIYPHIKATDPKIDGMILFANGNINISGSHTSTTIKIEYDHIDALMIANNQISLPDSLGVDKSVQQDGVEVSGSLLGFGNTSSAFFIERNLGLKNPTNPVLIVNYQPKYAKISEIFFGTDNKVYKQEVGFKF